MNWDALDALKYRPERDAIASLLQRLPLDAPARAVIQADAAHLVRLARHSAARQGMVENFLQEFSLATKEGLALMCLAEALLRTPDQATRDRLIAEAVGGGDWASHLGNSSSFWVNASTWSLMMTGRLVASEDTPSGDVTGVLRRMVGRLGAPVIRAGIAQAMRIMGEQFVLGSTIESALERAGRENYLCSFDMLGEGARSADDAARYEAAYARAVSVIGSGSGPENSHGVSVKLSALSPRYEAVQEARVMAELYPRLLRLAKLAAAADINLTLDAEENDRLVISLTLLERLTREAALGDWRGLGLAVQAYQKRAPEVVDQVIALARSSRRRLMVRLVKGAYWDSEIKRAQVQGRPDYPVYTTKPATDVSYLACARTLIAGYPHVYAQFATHNAHTLSAVHHMAGDVPIEFQRLHGMGEALYQAARETFGQVRLRAYAPVGAHKDLLPYLVRRLLENGANTSFVNQLLDESTAAEEVVRDPLTVLETAGAGPHPRLPPPPQLYGDRENSLGPDLSIRAERARLQAAVGAFTPVAGPGNPVVSPQHREHVLGYVAAARPEEVDAAFARARAAQPAWNDLGGAARAGILDAMADRLEEHRDQLIALAVLEAGKSYADGIAEVREAADFCRYYAKLARERFAGPETLKGPVGERNSLSLAGRGVFVCISPWNFPLAIFTGQIAAALAAGNAVIAKPAEQTPLIAREAVRLFRLAGLDQDLLALTPGEGRSVGEMLVRHPACNGVAFTGGTDTAARINRLLADRDGPIIPLIAETGGLNGMFIDTSAQREQVIDDVILSAFGSAGQRCSALRILFVPQDIADDMIEGLKGAMDALVVGDPADPATDVGPVIDEEARAALDAHLSRLKREAKVLHRLAAPRQGSFFAPVLAEIPAPDFLEKEVFGPILHLVRYDPHNPAPIAERLARRGYGLTLGIHSRIDGFVEAIRHAVPAGNIYVNRSIIGAVVGVQPFGGEGLSGTGPKAGGPNALSRYAVERALSINTAAQGGDPELMNL
ncbi:MAG TPA: bifunctional proline dehydrogenase/L-glutamate gamma-semialdehyde dehydrogenase PutA [Rhizomicrobium sp.]|nr:bifunctional proline dehydrogenase/L-glutamate gamma-semialdehyde dehydrogenase PutA [Rhizomicrobium sp.]